MSLSGAFTGVLGLAGLEVVLSSPRAVGALGSVGTTAAAVIDRFISPELGLIPNYHDLGGGAATVGPESGAGSTTTAEQFSANGTPTGVKLPPLPKTITSVTPSPGRKPEVAPPVGPTTSVNSRLNFPTF